MKRIIVSCLSIVMVISSCSSSKEARKWKNDINGTWTLQTITTDGINGKFNAKVFNEADYTCFIGSTWTFVANNSSGSYMLDGNTKDCAALTRLIKWSIYEPKGAEKEFQFKRMDTKKAALDNGDGFRLKVITVDDKAMQLRSNITFEGKPAGIIYNFTKK